MCPIATYKYHSGCTEVFDALDNCTTYRFDPTTKRLQSIEAPTHTQSFVWDEENRTLLEKRLTSPDQKFSLISKYAYDKNHNAIEEKVGDGTHWTTTKRSFSDDQFNLLLSESSQAGVETHIAYVPNTNLIASKFFVVDGEIQKRTFNTYDDCAICIETIIDDGKSSEPDDLTDVTYRKIISISPKQEMPCFGLPEIITEKSLDANGCEIQLGKVVCEYTCFGQIARETHYDSNDTLSYTLENTYDDKERLISSTDALGHTTYFTYDRNNNITSFECPDKEQHRTITYDLLTLRTSAKHEKYLLI